MSIKITQPFSFDSRLPNFERDIINSYELFASHNPLVLTDAERSLQISKYDIGHIVFDTNTEKYYRVGRTQTGLFAFFELKFTDTTLSGIAYCSTLGSTVAKEATMPGFALSDGQMILLCLTVSNTVANATLNVNGTGAKQILIGGSATTSNNFISGYWICTYDETNECWVCERFFDINDGGLSIKTNGDLVTTFTANQATDTSVNLKEGVGISLLEDSDSDGYNITISTETHHTVVSKSTITETEHHTKAEYYNVYCGLSDETLKVADLDDFASVDNQTYLQNHFVWTKTYGTTNQYMGICKIQSSNGRFVFKLDINDTRHNRQTTHYFGLLADSPSNSTFTFVTTCKWDIVVRLNPTDHWLVAFMKIPDRFEGTATLTPMRNSTGSGSTPNPGISSFEGIDQQTNYVTGAYNWGTVNGTVQMPNIVCDESDLIGNEPSGSGLNYVTPNFGDYYVNVIGDFNGMLYVGAEVSDIVMNDYYLHTLERRLESFEDEFSDFEDEINNLLYAQADWDESDTTSPSYILNKPDLAPVAISGDYNDLENKPTIPAIPNHRTVNHEQMTESGGFDGNVNIHDGYYFPNSVQDNDGNWYGAVVIGDQVWMAENLRTTTYTDGVELDKSMGLSDQYAYFYPIDENHPEKGNFYNWYGAMYGQPSSGTTPSGVQGVSPAGWHIPSDEEFKLLVEYLGRQRRYVFNGDNDATAKSIASTTGWTHQQNTLPGWPSVDMEDNNATGFNAIPTGYILDSILIQANTTRFWSSNCNENDDVFCTAIDGEADGIVTGYFTNKKALCAVRCLSDLNPVQFRDWYVSRYGTMQHHIVQTGVLNNPLHIGPYDYDGSQEVTIGIYYGDDSDDYSVN